ncbi:MAG: class I mannose-6-phosphate isomerase [Phycisphaerales bacterium]|nr:class I mannose-6-phosphate isomerase [Phycisphaerales bacterium]
MTLYPLKFEPIYLDKVWGGRRIESLGRTLPGGPERSIGESWELADLPDDAGGARSVVANGPVAGRTLRHVIEQHGEAIMGHLSLTEQGCFPLLVKYLDARESLSIQVHPDEAYAKDHPLLHTKNEAWYVIDAQDGAVIYKGVKEGITREAFAEHIRAGTVADALAAVPVKRGDCHYLPAGTCHAIGAGVMVAEIQTPSDTTFRIFDWGRTDRELHVEQALDCIHLSPPQCDRQERRSHIAGVFTTVSRLIKTDDFEIERIRMSEGYSQEIPYNEPAVWMVLEGSGVITATDAPAVEFTRGETLLIPASLTDARIELHEDTAWLDIQFPRARRTLLA